MGAKARRAAVIAALEADDSPRASATTSRTTVSPSRCQFILADHTRRAGRRQATPARATYASAASSASKYGGSVSHGFGMVSFCTKM